jgi:hypothetical protein
MSSSKSRRLSTLKVKANDPTSVKSLKFDNGVNNSTDDKAFSAFLHEIIAKEEDNVANIDLSKHFKGGKEANEAILKKVLQLGLAGKEIAQQLFVDELLVLLKDDCHPSMKTDAPSLSKADTHSSLKAALFSTTTGQEVLGRLLWCYNHNSQWKGSTGTTPDTVLQEICHDIRC